MTELETVTATHSAAVQHASKLLDAAAAAQREAEQAAGERGRLLERAASGEAVGTNDLALATKATAEAKDSAALALALADAAVMRTHQAEIPVLNARAADYQRQYEDDADAAIEAARRVDRAMKEITAALAEYEAAGEKVRQSHFFALSFNGEHQRRAPMHQNPLVNKMHPSVQPKAHVPQMIGLERWAVAILKQPQANSILSSWDAQNAKLRTSLAERAAGCFGRTRH